MKKHLLNDYYKFGDISGTRIEIYPNNNVASNLIIHHRSKGGVEIAVSDCISVSSALLPMPESILSELNKKIATVNEDGKQAVVTGIDAYLALLNEQNTKAFKDALRRRADEDKLNVIYMIGNLYIPDVNDIFRNPKYIDNLQLAIINGNINETTPPNVTLVSDKWVNGDNYVTEWSVLLKHMGNFSPTGSHTLALAAFNEPQAGLSSTVYQLTDLPKVAEKFYGIPNTLSCEVTEKLIVLCKSQNKKPLEVLNKGFEAGNENIRLGVKRLYELRSDELWTAYAWYLKQSVEVNSYLTKVISRTIAVDSFISEYVCDTALTLIEDINAEKYAYERFEALKQLSDVSEPKIIDFIHKSEDKADDTVIIWLNCGTDSEKAEILRRMQNIDLNTGLPEKYSSVYPALADYLSDEYPFEDNDLTDYFNEYRRQKNVQSATITKTRMPLSTEFNKIDWSSDRRLKGRNGIDNVSHYGAEKHEHSLPEENLCATFDKFDTIFNSIQEGLSSYERVIITADHGSSRLACIAHEKGLSRTLSWSGKSDSILSCRYTLAPNNVERPSDFEPFYDADNSKEY